MECIKNPFRLLLHKIQVFILKHYHKAGFQPRKDIEHFFSRSL